MPKDYSPYRANRVSVKMKNKKVKNAAIVFVLVIVLACLGLRYWLSSWDLFSSSISNPSLLGANADFEVPESARNTEGHFEGFNSFSMWGKFDMDSADFEIFKTNANCTSPFEPANEKETRSALSSRFDWWQPSDNSLICSGASDGCGKILIVDMADPTVYTVYVQASCG